jgi:hypothetical protein
VAVLKMITFWRRNRINYKITAAPLHCQIRRKSKTYLLSASFDTILLCLFSVIVELTSVSNLTKKVFKTLPHKN